MNSTRSGGAPSAHAPRQADDTATDKEEADDEEEETFPLVFRVPSAVAAAASACSSAAVTASQNSTSPAEEGLVDVARHIIGCHLTRATMYPNEC